MFAEYPDFLVADEHDASVAILELGNLADKFLSHSKHFLQHWSWRPALMPPAIPRVTSAASRTTKYITAGLGIANSDPAWRDRAFARFSAHLSARPWRGRPSLRSVGLTCQRPPKSAC